MKNNQNERIMFYLFLNMADFNIPRSVKRAG